MKLSELSDSARTAARDQARYSQIVDYWWSAVLEDATVCAAILGIEISKTRSGPHIIFSGFDSQGDGASFTGQYKYAPNAVGEIVLHCGGQDAELIRIATELTTLNVGRRLRGADEPLAYKIVASGRYCHSGTMSLVDDFYDDPYPTDAEENTLLRLVRAFADWIYKQLEAEHEHLTSDESVDLYLEDLDFDEFGTVI